MKRSGFTLWELIGGLALVVIVGAILWPVRSHVTESKIYPCVNNLKQIGLALVQYNMDYGQKMPLVVGSQASTKTTTYGWADAIYPYLKNKNIFQCLAEDTDGSKSDPTTRGYTDYWLNFNLSGLARTDINDPKKTITFGDGNDGSDLTDARYNLPALPAAWLSDQNSPAYRHDGGANYAFLDMHVKWLKPAEIATGTATFSPK